jgi:hypothetical protein
MGLTLLGCTALDELMIYSMHYEPTALAPTILFSLLSLCCLLSFCFVLIKTSILDKNIHFGDNFLRPPWSLFLYTNTYSKRELKPEASGSGG